MSEEPQAPEAENEVEQTPAGQPNEDIGRAEQMTNQIANSLFDGQPPADENGGGPPQKSGHSASSSKHDSSRAEEQTTANETAADVEEEEEIYEEEENVTSSVPSKEVSSNLYSSQKQSTSTSKRNSSRMNSQSPKKRPPRRQNQDYDEPPQEEVAAALDLLLHGVPPEDFDPTTLRCCIKQLQKLKKDAVLNKKYKEADYYAKLIKSSQKAADVAGFSTQCTQKLGYLMDKQADAQEKVDEINNSWVQQFEEFELMIDTKMKMLTDQQTQELEEFDQNTPSDLPPKYLKHSVEYVLMRKKERLLIRNEDYLTADTVKKKADALEQEELTKQHMKLQDDLQTERNALIKKHNQQYDAFALWMNSRRHDMLNARDKDLEGPVRRLEHYTRLVDRIEKKGLPPNPYYGFTTNRVSRKESIKAVRTAAQTPLERDPKQHRPREKPVIPQFRPSSAMQTQKLGKSNNVSSQNSSSQLPPC